MVKKKNKLKHKGGSNMTAYMQCSKRSAPHMKKGDPHIVTSTASHSKRIVDHIKNAQKYQTSHMSHYQKGGYAIKAKCDSVKKVSHTATPIKSTSVASASNPTYPGEVLELILIKIQIMTGYLLIQKLSKKITYFLLFEENIQMATSLQRKLLKGEL